MQTSDPAIYAVGDVVETADPIFPETQRAWVALGNVANMQARVAADHALASTAEIASAVLPYKGSYGTSIVRLFGTTLALTGWTEKRLKAAGIPYAATIVNASHHAGYYPNPETMTIKITYDPVTGKVYGGQAVGGSGVDKRIDVIATAIKGSLSVEDLSQLQLTYSPPFGSAKDGVNLVGLAARNEMDKTSEAIPNFPGDDRIIIDVRSAAAHASNPFPVQGGGKNIHFAELHTRHNELDKSKKYTAVCDWGRTAYFGQRTLRQAGFDCNTVSGGWRVQKMRDNVAATEAAKEKSDSKL
jgi:rhodanese-related sulfurtransferase